MRVARLVPELGASRPANDASRSTDPRIARALAAARARLAERWTVAKLAKVAGMSRAAFARRFLADVGVPPLRFLANERLRRAAALLEATDASLAGIAVEVGYATEFALGRAFRRVVGEPPGVYRRRVLAERRGSAPRCMAA